MSALHWTPAAPLSMPDADLTVLMWEVPSDTLAHLADWTVGYWDGAVWRYQASGLTTIGAVTHWCDPEAPNVGAKRQ